MLSRVAESIYWMGRQVERAENLARFIEVTLHLILDQPEDMVEPWSPLVEVTGETEWFKEKYGQATAENVVRFLAFDLDYHSSMKTCLQLARENARSVRESLSSESFEQLNEFYHFVNSASESALTDPTADFFDQIRRHALMWSGTIDSTMSHDIAWHFLNFGRLMERADKTSRILDVKYFNLLPKVEDVGTAVDDLQWSALLLAVSGSEAYRRQYHLIDLEKIVEFFLFHTDFPRSVRYCIDGASDSLEEIVKSSGLTGSIPAVAAMHSLQDKLATADVRNILDGGIHQFVDWLQCELNQIGSSLNSDLFHHPSVS